MPNRIIKETIKTSHKIDSLTWFEEVVYYRLLVTADDYGCMDGRPVLLKNELFPTKETVTRKAIEDAITKLTSVGLLRRYEADGKPYLFFPTWEKHQRIRNKHRKYPQPPDICQTLDSDLTDICQSNDCQMTASCQSESESNPNPNPNPMEAIASCAEPENPPAALFVEPPVISLPLNDGSEREVTESEVREWEQLYPLVDVRQELRSMLGWIRADPKRRKTKNGVNRFINGWLSRRQDRGGSNGGGRNNNGGNGGNHINIMDL